MKHASLDVPMRVVTESAPRKIKGLDNGVIAKPGKRKLGGFAELVAEGEDPEGLKVQTPNGTSRQDCRQSGRVYQGKDDRWCNDQDWDGDMSGN
jgi:hypothetical protein